ncbi:MAG: GNAT family N-acetyltransferase [Caldilineaceae bacterium]
MAIRVRAYQDDDLPRLQRALARWIHVAGDCGYYHVGNIAHRIYEGFGGSHAAAELVQVWEDDAEIIGFAYNFVFEAAFFVFCAPAYRGSPVELEMLRSAYTTTLDLMQETKQPETTVITDVFACDQLRIDLLIQLGFTHYRLWDYITERSLAGPLPSARLPVGFTMRTATLDDAVQLAALRNNAFGANWTGKAYREQVMQSPGYNPAREIVVVAPDGRLAAFTIIWLDRRNKVGLFEPVGTHSDFRRLGLARAMMCHALRQMQELGMERATVEHLAENEAARELYHSLGFRKKYETLGYRLA